MTERLLISIAEAAYMTDLSPDFIRAAIRRLELPAVKAGRAHRIRVADLETWIDTLERVS